MEDEWDWDRDEILDLDITGDPQLDQFGYQSPRRDFTPPPPERIIDLKTSATAPHRAAAR
jgi:hypothetical protein